MEFAVIIDDKIEFCSSEKDYAKFEIAIFADMLIKELGEQGQWKLHKIVFRDIQTDNDLKLLSCVKRPMIICLLGELKLGSTHGYHLLQKIQEQITKKFSVKNLKENLEEKRKEFE